MFVTGSTSGIGEGIVRKFLQEGEDVVAHGLSAREKDEMLLRWNTESLDPPNVLTGDLTDPDVPSRLVREVIDHHGRIDVLVNNAGRNVFTGVLESDLQDWDAALNLNLRAAWLVSKAAVPHVPRGGSIINISSNHAYTTMPGCFPYNVAKAGLLGLTNALAVELSSLGIRANAICPGWTETPPVAHALDDPAERRRVESIHLTGRLGTPEDVAAAAWYLAGATQVTGTHLIVDGGRSVVMEDPH